MIRIYKFPKWLKRFYPLAIWDFYLDQKSKEVYLTFDDGPTPEVTQWVLNELDKFKAKATFFCIGKNVKDNQELYAEYKERGHQVGNHSMNHIKGFKSSIQSYVADVELASKYIDSNLFRPPYGKCTPNQHRALSQKGYKTIFWSHITYDFDPSLSSQKRLENFKANVKNGSIIVCHDSVKAFSQLKTDLPLMLNYLKKEGYQFSLLT